MPTEKKEFRCEKVRVVHDIAAYLSVFLRIVAPIRADAITTLDSFRNRNKTITLICAAGFLVVINAIFFLRERA
jgi:hypothetical protein